MSKRTDDKTLVVYLDKGQALAHHPVFQEHLSDGWEYRDASGQRVRDGRMRVIAYLTRDGLDEDRPDGLRP